MGDVKPGLSAAIYARFSTDLQNERSTEDQIDLCRAFAQHNGFQVAATYADKAKSGASMFGRDGLMNLMQDAMAGRFNAVVVEDMSRLSRDMEDLAGIHKRLGFAGVKIIEVHGGEASTMTVALRGLIGQMYREDNVHKVRRGMAGLLKQGLSAGGKAYGYRPDPANRGKPIIVHEEAAIVLRIFEDYSKGVSPKAICRRLNAEHVKAPRAKNWAPSALIGFAARGTGMLRNSLYAGHLAWNKVHMVKDPATGKRLSRPNPESDWQTAEAPELRIVPQDLFEAVQAQLASRAHAGRSENVGVQRRPKRLLSGLLKCGACGSGMAVQGVDKSGRTRLRCSAHTNSGTCPEPKTFYLDEVEELVIDSLTKELASPEQIYTYAKTYMEQRLAEAAQENRRRHEIEARLSAIEKDNQRLLDMLLKGVGEQGAIDARMKEQGGERDGLKLELARLPEGSNIVVHPAAIKAFAERLQAAGSPLRSGRAYLKATLYSLDDTGELSSLIRDVIESITLLRDFDNRIVIRVTSWLQPFLKTEGKPEKRNPATGGWTDGSGRGT